jgi:PHD/YefM family antitoxin component YafN of YafNO toxin-antitoxin module
MPVLLKLGGFMPTLTIKSDKPVVVIPSDEYDALRETIEILSNRRLMNDIRAAIKEHEDGKSLDFEEFWRKEMNEA